LGKRLLPSRECSVTSFLNSSDGLCNAWSRGSSLDVKVPTPPPEEDLRHAARPCQSCVGRARLLSL